MEKFLKIFFVLLFLSSNAVATPSWNIIPGKSFIKFYATQNNAVVSGEFQKFSGQINFDPKDLKNSSVKMVIDMNSVNASYQDVPSNLKKEEWFFVQKFPQAIFEAKQFTKIGDKIFEAKGNLAIRDKTIPTNIKFTLEEYGEKTARVKGEAIIKRNDFGVGQKEWVKTDSVKNEVKVEFAISAVK